MGRRLPRWDEKGKLKEQESSLYCRSAVRSIDMEETGLAAVPDGLTASIDMPWRPRPVLGGRSVS